MKMMIQLREILINNPQSYTELKKEFPYVVKCIYNEELFKIPDNLYLIQKNEIYNLVHRLLDNQNSLNDIIEILDNIINKLSYYITNIHNHLHLNNIASKENDRYLIFDTELDKFFNMIFKNENFTLMRWGDGERSIMLGREFVAQEGWRISNGESKFGQELYKVLKLKDEKVWHGISCPCCDVESYYWYKNNVISEQITFATLWVNSNYKKFVKRFPELQRDAVIIANACGKGKRIGNLNILKYYEVSDNSLEFFNNNIDYLIESVKHDFGNKNNLLYAAAAGPLSEYIIFRLFKNNPNNCYIDFGSSLDLYIYDKITRPYMIETTEYAKRLCFMYNPKHI